MQQGNFAPVFDRPTAGQPVTQILAKEAKSPRVKVKFANVLTPFFYPNSPQVPRHSVTCIFDPDMHKEFIQKVHALEAKEKVENNQTFKPDTVKEEASGQIVTSGKLMMKFQTRDKIPVIVCKDGFPQTPAELRQELIAGDEVIVVFDVVRYTKRVQPGQSAAGISYQPKLIYLYPCEQKQTTAHPSYEFDETMPF